MTKELTSRQVRERAEYEAEKEPKKPRASALAYLRKQAGWPPLREKG